MPRALDGYREAALILGRQTRLAPRLDLAALRDEPPQLLDVFVRDVLDFVRGIYRRAAAVAASGAAATRSRA